MKALKYILSCILYGLIAMGVFAGICYVISKLPPSLLVVGWILSIAGFLGVMIKLVIK